MCPERQRVKPVNSERQIANAPYNTHITPRRYPIPPMQNISPYARPPTGMPLMNPVQSSMHTPVQSPSVQRTPMTVTPIPMGNSYQFQARAGINQRLSQQVQQSMVASTKQTGRRTKGGKNKTTMQVSAASAYEDTEEPSGGII